MWSIDDVWGLEWEVESTPDIHIPVRTGGIFYFPWHRRDQRFLLSHPKDTGKRGKRNCQSPEEKSVYRSGTRNIERPVAGRRPNPLGHRSRKNLALERILSTAVAISELVEEINTAIDEGKTTVGVLPPERWPSGR